jgi:hypothetical protein
LYDKLDYELLENNLAMEKITYKPIVIAIPPIRNVYLSMLPFNP